MKVRYNKLFIYYNSNVHDNWTLRLTGSHFQRFITYSESKSIRTKKFVIKKVLLNLKENYKIIHLSACWSSVHN